MYKKSAHNLENLMNLDTILILSLLDELVLRKLSFAYTLMGRLQKEMLFIKNIYIKKFES